MGGSSVLDNTGKHKDEQGLSLPLFPLTWFLLVPYTPFRDCYYRTWVSGKSVAGPPSRLITMSGKTFKTHPATDSGSVTPVTILRGQQMIPQQKGLWSLAMRMHGPAIPHAHLQAGAGGSFCLLGLTACKLDVIKKN